MISSHSSLSTPVFHPARPTALIDAYAMSTVHPLIDHLYLDWARDPNCRCCLQVSHSVASRCSALAWSFSITVPHPKAESMIEGVSCLCIPSVSGALLLRPRQALFSPNDGLDAFATELASMAT